MSTISKFFFGNNREATDSDLNEIKTDSVHVLQVSVGDLRVNPSQPRKLFYDESLSELAASIREFGVLQPLIVRKGRDAYELIAGERRLRAATLVGLDTVPCIVREVTDREMAEIALIENLQREDLHYFEEAEGYEFLLTQFALTQDVLAERMGKDQSTIANKLRLLRLSSPVRETILREKLSERHARALLKIEPESDQLSILQVVVAKKLNVRDTESLIDTFLKGAADQVAERRHTMRGIIKDVRIFINTLGELAKQMRKAGLDVQVRQEQDDDFVTITMVVPKRR